MNIDEEVEAVGGGHNWLREGRYLCQIAGMEEVFNSKSGNHGVQFILQAAEGKTKQALWLKGNCLWTWQVFAKACGVDEDTRHNMPLEYNEANLIQLTQSLDDEKKAKAQCQVVVGNWPRLEGIFMHRKVGAVVEDGPPSKKDNKVYGRVAQLFELTPDDVAKVAEAIPIEDDDIPF
jgi:hypothetical protein